MAEITQPVASPEGAPVSEKNNNANTADQNADVASVNTHAEPVGERDDSIRAHFRFLWVTVLVGCSLLEYGFDQGIIGSFQAMVGFLMVYGYEDPRVPSGWVSSVPEIWSRQQTSDSLPEYCIRASADHRIVHAPRSLPRLLHHWTIRWLAWETMVHYVGTCPFGHLHHYHDRHHLLGGALLR
jgi:hypothetical protein